MKSLKLFGFFVLLFGLVALVACTEVYASEDAYVTLDINPSVELVVNPRDKVLYANALNEDGEILLAGLDLVGMDLKDAIDLIIEEAIYLGFIDIEDEDIDISISTIAKTEQVRERVQNRVKENVNNAFEKRAMVGRAIDKDYQDELIEEADAYGVTPGFLRLAKSVLLQTDAYTLEELLEMSQEALIDILKGVQEEHRALMHSVREDFFTARDEIHAYYAPLFEALYEALEAEDADIEAIEAEIAALRLEKHDALEALRSEFVETTQLLAQEMRLVHNERKAMHQERVEAFLEEVQERREQMQERIEEYQKRRP